MSYQNENLSPQNNYELSDEDIYQDYNTFNLKPFSAQNKKENNMQNFNRNLDENSFPLLSLEKQILRKKLRIFLNS